MLPKLGAVITRALKHVFARLCMRLHLEPASGQLFAANLLNAITMPMRLSQRIGIFLLPS